MRKLIPAAVLACLGVVAASVPAEAGAYVGVSVGVPGVAVVAPYALPYRAPYGAPYYHAGPRYFYPEYAHYGYGVPYGYGVGFRSRMVHGRPWHR